MLDVEDLKQLIKLLPEKHEVRGHLTGSHLSSFPRRSHRLSWTFSALLGPLVPLHLSLSPFVLFLSAVNVLTRLTC